MSRFTSITPQRNLWVSVLARAVMDAKEKRGSPRKEAIEYLTTPSADLKMVCDGAGYDMDNLVSKSKVYFN